jgi:SAM-dependent methyltransferase
MADTPWYDDDAFWEALEPFMSSKEHDGRALAEVDDLERLLKPTPGAHILDLGCGAGHHSLELARRGYRMTALDRTSRYLDVARRKATEDGLQIEFVFGDMREYARPEAFDYVINMNTSGLSYFPDVDSDRQVASNVRASLRQGGKFVVQTVGKEVLARIFQKRDWQERDGVFFLQERNVARDWSWMENRWVFIHGGSAREYQVTHRLYSGSGLCGLMRECGFSDVFAYGDLRGSPYDAVAASLVVVATK